MVAGEAGRRSSRQKVIIMHTCSLSRRHYDSCGVFRPKHMKTLPHIDR